MKWAGLSVLVSFALLSQAFAVLRPLFPIKPAPPFDDQTVGIGDDFLRAGLILHENDWPYIFIPDQQFRGRAIQLNRPCLGSDD
jgi:hypothetical protein